MALRIPRAQRPGLELIASLPDTAVEELAKAIADTPPAISPTALARQITKSVTLPFSDLTSVLTVLVSLTLTVERSRMSVEQVASDVGNAFAAESSTIASTSSATPAESSDGTQKVPAEEAERLRRRLLQLLSAGQTLEISARSSGIYFAYDTLFHTARILSDIRPIFASDDIDKPVAGMIVHNLELELLRDGDEITEYIAFNIHDLKQLKSVIDRALAKDIALREVIRLGGMAYVEDVPNETQL
jgi:hypothetical protein